MFRITSKEQIFFDLFDEVATDSLKAANLLDDLINNYENIEEKIKEIEAFEHRCDNHAHKMFEQLNKSFITPIDREDIHSIGKEMDNITDCIESAAHRFKMFNVKVVRDDARQMSKLIVQITGELKTVLSELKKMKSSKILKEKIIEVNRLENKGDEVFRNAIENLFKTEKDAVEVLKWKEIYEDLENTMDACEDVANIIEGVVMKHS